jgi:GMP synthase (glutamine-hydrolysing)
MILIIDCGSSKTSAIKDVVGSLPAVTESSASGRQAGRGFLCQAVKLSLLSPKHIAEAKGIIISGAPILLTESYPALFAEKFSFLKSLNVPALGICFGLQVMALAFGEQAFLGAEVRRQEKVSFHFSDPLTEGIPADVMLAEDHTEGIGLPDDDFFLLASSAHYEVEAMKHKKKPIYGVQFHPEVSGEFGITLLENFCRMCV